MGKPDAPEPTPPRETSAAATGTNVSTAIANNIMGNITEIGPDGRTVVRRTGNYQWTDPYTKEEYTVPTFTRKTILSPEQQRIQAQQNATKLNLSRLANDQSGFLKDYMAKPFSYDENSHEKWALGIYDKLNADKNTQDMENLRSQMANSGIKLGSDAFDRAMRSETEAKQRSRDQFMLDSYQTGFGSAQATRNQPINEITALMSGSQVSQPQFMGLNNFNRIPTTDNAGIIANYDQQKLQAWQMEQAMRGQLLGGLFGLGGAILSDRRAKKDIEKTGTIKVKGDDGKMHRTGTYDYRYKWQGKDTPKTSGVMAQNLARVKPSAVMTLGSGLKAVDYSAVLN